MTIPKGRQRVGARWAPEAMQREDGRLHAERHGPPATSMFEILRASLRRPRAGAGCHPQGVTRQPRSRRSPSIRGWFPPPSGTLELGIGRQPNGYTCGTETFLGVCEFLRLPVEDPDDDDLASYSAKLKTSAKYGTDPEDIVATASSFLKIEARVANDFGVARLAELTNDTQAYVEHLLDGGPITKPLEIAMVTYQAYLDPDHVRSWEYPGGRRRALRTGTARLKSIRKGKRVLWENDWTDGHWSAVLRVVQEPDVLSDIEKRVRAEHVRDGLVILGDPSNGEGLSFVPIPEFERRWHDTDRQDNPRLRQTAVVLHVPKRRLEQMRRNSAKRGVPMFATVWRNAVTYVP